MTLLWRMLPWLLRTRAPFTSPQVAARFDVSTRTARRVVGQLAEAGLVLDVGTITHGDESEQPIPLWESAIQWRGMAREAA